MGRAHQVEGGTYSYIQGDVEGWWERTLMKFIWFKWHRGEKDGSFTSGPQGPEGRLGDRNYWKDNPPI